MLKVLNHQWEIDKPLFAGEFQDGNGVNCRNTETPRGGAAIQIIHEDSIRPAFQGKLKSLCFAFMQTTDGLRLREGGNLKPRPWRNNPVFYFLRSSRMKQLVANAKRNEDVIKEVRKDFGAIDENQIMERTRVGNDNATHLPGDATEIFQI